MTTRLSSAAVLAALVVLTTSSIASANDAPSQGALRALSPDRTPLGECPLDHTDVDIEVSGYVARTRVTQRFVNPFSERIEALYIFPLPERAAVRNMEMRVGDRMVKAEIQRREDARETYEGARSAGKTASLLEQERPNIFTTSVANIRPGIPIEVTLEYVHTLKYDSGTYRLAFPMTVGPRFIPGTPAPNKSGAAAHNTDRVPDGARIQPPVAPRGRSGHDISVSVDLDAGVPMSSPRSSSHRVSIRRRSPNRARIALYRTDSIPNRDFLLEWTVSPTQVDTGVITHRANPKRPGFLTLMLHPQAAPPPSSVTPKEIVFVLDTSGSMYGRPMELSKKLMRRLIRNLHPADTFAVLRYNDAASALSPRPLANTPANRKLALDHIETLEGEGGTDALGGVRAAFAYPRDEQRLRVVVFLSDGYIGNETEVLAELQSRIGAARLFSFGVGSSVNRFLLEGMAREGRGAARIVTEQESPRDAVDGFYKRLQSPYLTDIEIDWGDLDVDRAYPHKIPDLFAGTPLEVHARYRREGSGTVVVRGRLGGHPFVQQVPVTLPARSDDHRAIASIWARERIEELSRAMYQAEHKKIVKELTQVALRHRLLSKYTSFVAVERRLVPAGDRAAPTQQIAIPAELPQGVSPARIFGSSLSLARFQPGDPELRVSAPASTRLVTAVFPFGETKELRYEPRLGIWTTRFLVPRDTPEGNYRIRILVTLRDGQQIRLSRPYTVDASAPDISLELLGEAAPGAEVRIRARQRFTAADRALHGRTRAQILSDIARIQLQHGKRPSPQTPIPLDLIEPGVWEGRMRIPADLPDSTITFSVTAHDVAGNRGARTIKMHVPRRDARPRRVDGLRNADGASRTP